MFPITTNTPPISIVSNHSHHHHHHHHIPIVFHHHHHHHISIVPTITTTTTFLLFPTMTATITTFLLFSTITTTTTTFLLFPPSPLSPHFYCFSPSPPPPHFYCFPPSPPPPPPPPPHFYCIITITNTNTFVLFSLLLLLFQITKSYYCLNLRTCVFNSHEIPSSVYVLLQTTFQRIKLDCQFLFFLDVASKHREHFPGYTASSLLLFVSSHSSLKARVLGIQAWHIFKRQKHRKQQYLAICGLIIIYFLESQ